MILRFGANCRVGILLQGGRAWPSAKCSFLWFAARTVQIIPDGPQRVDLTVRHAVRV
jgi:hypothetical protein